MKRIRSFFRMLWWLFSSFLKLLWWPFMMFGRLVGAFFKELHWLLFEELKEKSRGGRELVNEYLNSPAEMWAQTVNHLVSLRTHLVRAVSILVFFTIIAFSFAGKILDVLARPIGGIQNVQAVEVLESIGVFMRVSLLVGFAVSSPLIIFELLLFVAEGLTLRERRIGFIAIPAVTILFVGGMAFAYFVMLTPALDVLIGFMDIPTLVRPSSYFNFITSLMFWIGVSFEFPLVIFVLVLLGLVKAEFFRKHARVALVLLAVFAAMITPTVDPVNMLLVWGPLVVLYFIGLLLAEFAQRIRDRRKRREEAEAVRSNSAD